MNSHFIQQIIIYYYHCFYAQNDPGLPSESRLKLFPVSFWHIPYLSLNSSFLYVVVPNSNTSLLYGSDPQLFWHQRPFSWKTTFPWRGGDGLGMIQVHYIYCALYSYYYYISSTSDHQALYPGVWGPLLYGTVRYSRLIFYFSVPALKSAICPWNTLKLK